MSISSILREGLPRDNSNSNPWAIEPQTAPNQNQTIFHLFRYLMSSYKENQILKQNIKTLKSNIKNIQVSLAIMDQENLKLNKELESLKNCFMFTDVNNETDRTCTNSKIEAINNSILDLADRIEELENKNPSRSNPITEKITGLETSILRLLENHRKCQEEISHLKRAQTHNMPGMAILTKVQTEVSLLKNDRFARITRIQNNLDAIDSKIEESISNLESRFLMTENTVKTCFESSFNQPYPY